LNTCFRMMAAGSQLPPEAARRLRTDGFCVVPGPVLAGELGQLARAYDKAMVEADPADRREGSTTVRVHDFVNRTAGFDPLYIHGPLLEACYQIIGQPFKLSAMIGRTLLSGKPAQQLHVDCARDVLGWTMVGFIFMMDQFRSDNGATCFLPRSHQQGAKQIPNDELVPACGPAGSMVIYNGSVWHGHGANTTGEPRRSVQGAFIRREAAASTDFASRMRPETLDRIGPVARYLLAI
jgi:Phytanoyl-CoA dioxygenase (PhyH)